MSVAFALKAAWADVLDIDAEDIKDDSNFVELGGDSVAAIRLVQVAPKHGLHLDAESVFAEGIFCQLVEKASMMDDEKKASLVAPQEEESTADPSLIQTCASACGLPVEIIEDVYLPPFMSGWFFQAHQNQGSWLLQIVFQLTDDLDPTLACSAFEAIHDRNQAFRSRYVDLNGTVQCVVARTPIAWQHATDLEAYKSSDRARKVTQGQPAVRHALIREPQATTYIVWTALHSVMDTWTRKLLCDDLSAFLRDPAEFRTRPSRPSVKLFLQHFNNLDPAASTAFWTSYLAGLENPQPLPTIVAKPTTNPVCNRTLVRSYPLSQRAPSPIRLSTIAHAAFALTLGALTPAPSTSTFFYGIRASRAFFPLASAIMGSIFSGIPVRIALPSAQEPVSAFLARVQADSAAMVPHEPFGWNALHTLMTKDIHTANAFTFNWFPRGTDLLAREDMRERERGGESGGALKVVSARYSPHEVAGVWMVYDNGESLRVVAEWDDGVFEEGLAREMVDRFLDILERLAKGEGERSVGAVLGW